MLYFLSLVLVRSQAMEGDPTEEPGSRKDDLQWLQSMRERHNRNVKAMSGKRVERLRKSVERKVLKAIEEASRFIVRT